MARPVGAPAVLTVVVLSAALQEAVPAQGLLLDPTGDSTRIQTGARGEPLRLEGLRPGRYRLRITHRRLPGGGLQAVEGALDVYLEPGARRAVTVVAADRVDDVGCVDAQSPSLPAPAPYLPLGTAPGGDG